MYQAAAAIVKSDKSLLGLIGNLPHSLHCTLDQMYHKVSTCMLIHI